MQEEVENRTLTLVVSGTKFTGRLLKAAISKYMAHCKEKRNVVTALIKEIEIYRNDESEYPLKRIGLNFPVFKDGGEVTELLWDKGNTVETVCLLVK